MRYGKLQFKMDDQPVLSWQQVASVLKVGDKVSKDGKPTGKFELHKVQRDSEGKERYIKTEEDDAI